MDKKRLKECVDYDQNSGLFIWVERPVSHFSDGLTKSAKHICNAWNSRWTGTSAGNLGVDGYIRIDVFSSTFLAHTLAWLYVYGYFSENEIDHIDRDRANNSISNLRETSKTCNCQNRKIKSTNKSGVTGVSFAKDRGLWRASITIHKRVVNLGQFDRFEDAVIARYLEEKNNDLWSCSRESSAHNYLVENNIEVS